MKEINIGEKWRGKKIREFVKLSNDWYVIKTDNTKTKADFKVRTVFSIKPRHSMTPKHAHFAIDLYGKICADREKGLRVLKAVDELWHGNLVTEVLKKYRQEIDDLPGYTLEYFLYALRWILDQEDINFAGRPDKKQRELDDICEQQGVLVPSGRKGSQLAVSLLCDIANGAHPVEALLRANLDVLPRRRRIG